ncbi:MAG: GNAT family N-acetyltransferase [Actinomycetota bacterium]|jgi:GNAT superfamily N-acetyltransferase|nr:GNAT family N-acetyltransferase [Actinomycetota bacterium]
MTEGCRTAQVADLDTIAQLAGEAVDEQRDARGGPMWSRRETQPPPYRMSLEGAFYDPDQEIWVGTIDETIVGYAVCRLEVLRTGELLAVVTDLFVVEGAREVAIGETMMDAIVSWCEERECVGIDSLALPGNRQTKNFFETFGFKARLLTMHRSLKGFDGA